MAININKALDKAYEGKSLKELCDMPLSGFAGLTEESAKHLEKLGLKTVRDLAEWKYVLWAQGIVALAKAEQ
jgi:predicted RecB family nuclease